MLSLQRAVPKVALFLAACAFAWAQAEGDKLAPGRFLVASRDMGDPNFAESVVLLVQYDDQHGAMGLIVNRRTDVPLSRVFEDWEEAKSRTDRLYIGGPVDLNSVAALVKAGDKLDGAKRIFGDVYLVSSKDALQKALASGTDASGFHAYIGYAGWETGQLEHEIDTGAWHIMSADASDVFHSEPESLWQRLIRQTETRIARAAAPLWLPASR